jgi:hypothetical protein
MSVEMTTDGQDLSASLEREIARARLPRVATRFRIIDQSVLKVVTCSYRVPGRLLSE